ncbi:MAG: adenylate/guanylate cyclase domain-containing protein, partial [Deltaproteobacteria bacterium]|nr:adenylate/guanylate cyclase domain-containing protein [Deltaproteobacteria bacterium]
MDKDHINRKLTAIFSTDVAGYSRLMGDDEEATVHTLKKYKKIICELIEGNKGRVIDSPGDNLLAEFVSVVDAVRCAILIQNDLKANNETLSSDRKMEFRIGINIGDVIQDGERIYGDGVNVAARIESLAEPGGICISRNAYDQVKKKMHIQYEYLGEHEVKNIDEAVRVYKVLIDSITDELFGEEGTIESAHLQSVDYPQSDKPSIVVLPFVNISGDPEQEYFSDGITEELISALARIQGLRVIPRTSAFYFKGEHVDLQTVCEKLNVENVIEGSIRKAGNKLRITAKLIKAAG